MELANVLIDYLLCISKHTFGSFAHSIQCYNPRNKAVQKHSHQIANEEQGYTLTCLVVLFESMKRVVLGMALAMLAIVDGFVLLGRKQGTRLTPPTMSMSARTDCDDAFVRSMNELGYTNEQQSSILEELQSVGLFGNQSSRMLISVTQDFMDAPQSISTLLKDDFQLSVLAAHQIRAALLNMRLSSSGSVRSNAPGAAESLMDQRDGISSNNDTQKPLLYKQVVVNHPAKRRKGRGASATEYGLPKNYQSVYPKLGQQLEDFYQFMVYPQVDTQHEDPIRPATANVYLRHAKLFLGWHLSNNDSVSDLYEIFPSTAKESAQPVIAFLLWLRGDRNISVSYEANLLRGLTKLLKFRFRADSHIDDSSSKSFDDIPAIRELRKLHRHANKKQGVAPRSSEEDRKWLSWPQYLDVVKKAKEHVEDLLSNYQPEFSKVPSPQQRKIAVAFQKYLILACFAEVPDRQRTIRELEIGRSFIKEKGQYCIKHAPDDYKTGKTYGERPPLYISRQLTPAVDEFIDQWRPFLSPTHDFLFSQVRTGNPLSQDSVYQIVSRTCFMYSGQRTNPHLLRDMVRRLVDKCPNNCRTWLSHLKINFLSPLDCHPRTRIRRHLRATAGGSSPLHGAQHPSTACQLRPADALAKSCPRCGATRIRQC